MYFVRFQSITAASLEIENNKTLCNNKYVTRIYIIYTNIAFVRPFSFAAFLVLAFLVCTFFGPVPFEQYKVDASYWRAEFKMS